MQRNPPVIRTLLTLLPVLAACQAGAPATAPQCPPQSSVGTSPPEKSAKVPTTVYEFPRTEDWTGVSMIFSVALDAQGVASIDGKVVSDEELRQQARDVRERDQSVRAVIQADALAPWKHVIHVMDLLKQTGMGKVAFGIVTQAPATPSNAPSAGNASSPPTLEGRSGWDCPFPAAADAAAIDNAMVMLVVSLGADGAPQWAQILNDPGYDFGVAAAQCAKQQRYIPARDAQGNPQPSKTPPIRVRFTR